MSSRSDTKDDVQKALVGGQQAQIDFKVFRERNPTALSDKKRLTAGGQYKNSPESSPSFEE